MQNWRIPRIEINFFWNFFHIFLSQNVAQVNPFCSHRIVLNLEEEENNFIWEKVWTTKITTSKTKKNSENSVDDQNIEKIYKSDQNIEIQKDQNIESDLPMAFCLLT